MTSPRVTRHLCARRHPRTSSGRTWVAALALALLLPVSACRCSKDDPGASSGPSATATGSTGASAADAALALVSFQLDNGMAVELVTGACGDTTALAVQLNVGIGHDPDGRSGLSHLTERMLTGWTADRKGRAIAVGSEYTLYSVDSTPDTVMQELDAVAAWMGRVPSEEDLAGARKAALEELSKLDGADAAGTAMRLAEEAVSPTRSNGRRRGIAAQLEAITLEELQAFWAAHAKPGNARAVVVGRFDAQKLRAGIEAAFAKLAAGAPATLGPPGDSTIKGTLVMGDAPKAVAIAVLAPALSDEAFPAFLVAAARLQEKPATGRSWTVTYDPLMRPEVLLIGGPVGQAEQPEPAAARMRSEVDAILKAPFTAADATRTAEAFRLFLDNQLRDPALCSQAPRAFAIARARRAQLKDAPDAKALATAGDHFAAATALFGPAKTAAVIAGGTIR